MSKLKLRIWEKNLELSWIQKENIDKLCSRIIHKANQKADWKQVKKKSQMQERSYN